MATRFPHGTRKRAARAAAGLSVEQAAIHDGRTAYTVAGYETGKIEPPIHVLASLVSLYGTTLGALLDERVVA